MSKRTAAARLDALRHLMNFQYMNHLVDANIYKLVRRPYTCCNWAICFPKTEFSIQRELDVCIEGLTPVTRPVRRLHESHVLKFAVFSAAHDGPWLSIQTIEDWVKELDLRMVSSGVWSHVYSLSLFLDHLKRRELIERDLLGELKMLYPAHGLAGIVNALRAKCMEQALAGLCKGRDFRSYLASAFREYLHLKRATGRIYQYEQTMLQKLDRFLYMKGAQLDSAAFDEWLQTIDHLHSTTQTHYYNQVRQFCAYLRRSDACAFVPAARNKFVSHPLRMPTILSEDEVGRLFDAADRAPQSPRAPLSHRVLAMMLSLLYCCGLRLGEVLRLDIGDVDLTLGLLTVRNTKFYKTRYVPMDVSVARKLADYLDARCKAGFSTALDAPVFPSSRKQRFFKTSARKALYALMEVAKIRSSRRRVRIHDLRHTFAVHRMVSWYRNGGDVQANLPILSQYMGHVDISYTQKYLQLVPDLCGAAMERFHAYAPKIRKTDDENR